jgi:hypothetical protein
MTQNRRTKVKDAEQEIDTEQLALHYWLLVKAALATRRQNAAKAKAKRERRER